MIYSLIKIDYSSALRKHKRGQVGLVILDYLNEAISTISNYAANNFKKYSLFFMEAFLVEASQIVKEDKEVPKSFIVELRVIREMTGRLTSHKIEKRWGNLLGGVTWSTEEGIENDLYVKSLKHKYSINYSALYEY